MIARVTIRLLIVLVSMLTFQSVPAETVQIPLSGIGSVRSSTALTVAPPVLNVGDVIVGTTKDQNFSITYQSDSNELPVAISSIEVSGADASDFNTDYSGNALLEPGQILDFTVTFNPVTVGAKKAFLRISHTGGNSPHMVLLTGKGIDVPASELKLSTAEVDFGSIETDGTKNQKITLTNAGGNNYPAINIYNVIVSGDAPEAFGSNFNNVITINPGASVELVTTLSSGVAGTKVALLNIQHDGANPALKVKLTGKVTLPPDDDPDDDPGTGTEPGFLASKLNNASPNKPTSLQFGPDGKLYVSERDGFIYQYSVKRNGKNSYSTTATDKINLVQKIVNHNDDGTVNGSVKGRLVTGILVTGTANKPVIYVASGDPRMGAGPSGNDVNLDTNSVIISKLTKNGGGWTKQDLVRGLPRSEENHQGNGMQLSKDGKTLYISMGGHTNMGQPSNNFAKIPEYALSAAIVEINLNQIGNSTYDLPTLDDEDRAGVTDNNDPFGGNNGKNMAKLTANGPVQIYSPGWRNAYDLLITEGNKMYTVDNGPNSGWGGKPTGSCIDNYTDGGNTYGDGLHYISNKGYYGGHPNPTRGNKANKFNDSNPQSPIEGAANGVECQFKIPGTQDNALHVFKASTNGLTEYTASNFGGSMKGDLLTGSFDRSIYRIQLNANGSKLSGIDKLFTQLGTPLDVTALSDTQIFPGTIWVADYAENAVHVFEPNDY